MGIVKAFEIIVATIASIVVSLVLLIGNIVRSEIGRVVSTLA